MTRWMAIPAVLVLVLAGCAAPDAGGPNSDGPDGRDGAVASAPTAGSQVRPDQDDRSGGEPNERSGTEGQQDQDGQVGQDGQEGSATVPEPVTANWTDELEITVPLDVVLLGFPNTTVATVQERLSQEWSRDHFVLHNHGRYDFQSPSLPGGGYSTSDLPLHQAVRFVVQDRSADLPDYLAAVQEKKPDGRWDGDAAQRWAAGQAGAWDLQGALPPLVVVHAGSVGHAYRVDFPNGYWDEARVMGGLEPVLVLDLSAGQDEYTGASDAWMTPVEPSNAQAVEDAVREAVRFRLMHGPLYPIPTEPCHAVTLVYAVHATGEAPVLGGITAAEAFDPDLVQAAFSDLTREPVHVDAVRLDIPADDPALWALVRGQTLDPVTGAGVYETRAMTRAWVEAHWDDYHVEHEGCAEYLSLLVWSDTAENWAYGIAEYDGEGRRFSFSLVPEYVRGAYEPGLLGGGCCKSTSVYGFQFVNMLFAHETGHLFGQAHPHNALDGEEDLWAFSSTTTTMSYLTDEREISFGALDPLNWDRNRLGFLAPALEKAGAKDAAIEAGFLDAVRQGDFRSAAAIAQGLL